MKVIITGATGFIGRNIAEAFYADGIEVLATGRSEKVGKELTAQGIAFQAADIAEESRIMTALAPADVMIHCAAKAGDWGRIDDFRRTNIIGTRNIIAACKKYGISKIVFLSTPSMYYTGEDRLNISEDEPLPNKMTSIYSRTKLTNEQELLALKSDGIRTIILRPRAVFGPYDNIIIPRILGMAQKASFPLINGGRALVDITYVGNLVEAVRLCLNAPDNAWNEVYNISNGEPITIRDWFAQVTQVFGFPFNPKSVPLAAAKAKAGWMELLTRLPFGPKKPTMTRFSVGYMAKSMTLSLEKAKAKLGYTPPIDNAESFNKLIEWYSMRRKQERRKG
ncbi:MAG: NAD(P)-dependent oxidoreductase [Candidatus Zixiibacteriota bacterium]